jgi:hypothetical protein
MESSRFVLCLMLQCSFKQVSEPSYQQSALQVQYNTLIQMD